MRTDVTECNVRYVLLHMIAETARHAGHADIIRETFEVVHGEERVSFFAQLVRLHHAGARARGQ